MVLCDDHQMVRQALGDFLTGRGVEVRAVVADAESLLEAVSVHSPRVVLLDIALGGENGIDALHRLKADHPGVRVIMLTSFETSTAIVSSYQAGADAFMLKTGDGEGLVKCIRDVDMGLNMFNPEVVRRARADLEARGINALTSLDSVDRDILRLLGTGATDQQIANAVFLSLQTVRNRVSRLLRTFDRENRTQLALFVSTLEDGVL